MGRLAKIAINRLRRGLLKARLWEISWMARKRFWLAVAPKTYATAQNFHEKNGVDWSIHARKTWRETTPRTTHFVRGSGPQSLVICRRKARLATSALARNQLGGTNLRVRLDDCKTTGSMRLLGVCPEEIVIVGGIVMIGRRSWGWAIALCPRCDGRGVCRSHGDG